MPTEKRVKNWGTWWLAFSTVGIVFFFIMLRLVTLPDSPSAASARSIQAIIAFVLFAGWVYLWIHKPNIRSL